MKRSTKAYNELMNLLLSDEDREKFEWAVGSALVGGPRNVVIIYGPAARTGKSTLLNIVRGVILHSPETNFNPRIALQYDGYVKQDPDVFVFAASNTPRRIKDSIKIEVSGHRFPANKFHVLMQEINSELITIAENCINRYHISQENDR